MTRIAKVALEEHFMGPGFERRAQSFLQHADASIQAELSARLVDFDGTRLAAMDEAGIELAILSQTLPGVQAEAGAADAVRQARQSNDFLARQVARHPTRYAGLAALPMQDPKAAADELARAVRDLGFKGALVNGHTNGTYYDDRRYDAFWSKLQEIDVPLYLHPADAFRIPAALADHPELQGAAWGWGVETASHALRLLFGGVFDRFPAVKIILGHMGEGLPFQRWRLDSRFAAYPHGLALARAPSEYIGSNIVITTSGVCSPHALVGAIAEMGAEAVMFSVDYPYESAAVAAQFIETAPLDEAVRRLVCSGNATRLFKLGGSR